MSNESSYRTENTYLFQRNESPSQIAYSTFQNYSQDKFYQTYQIQISQQKTYSHIETQKGDSSQLNKTSFQTLDYGQKLAANHCILKDLLQMVDSKLTSRTNQKKQELGKFGLQSGFKGKYQKQMSNQKLQNKLIVVRQKLKDVIKEIDRQIPSQHQLIENQDLTDKWNKIENYHYHDSNEQKMKVKQQKKYSQKQLNFTPLNLDRSKFDNAKQVLSQQFLNPSDMYLNDKQSKRSHLKSSLDKISEAVNDEYFQKQSNEKSVTVQVKSAVMHESPTKKENKLLEESVFKQLDQTGRIILSTINKTTVSTATIARPTTGRNQVKSYEQIKNQKVQLQKNQDLGNVVKRNKFWRGKNSIVQETTNKSHRQQAGKLEVSSLVNKSQLLNRLPSKQKKLFNTIYQESQQQSPKKLVSLHQQSLSSSMRKLNQYRPLKYESSMIPSRNQLIDRGPVLMMNVKENLTNLNRESQQRIVFRNSSIPNFRQSSVNYVYKNTGFVNNIHMQPVRVINPEHNIIRPVTQVQVRNHNERFSKNMELGKLLQPSNRARSLPNNHRLVTLSSPNIIKKNQNISNLQHSTVSNINFSKNHNVYINNNHAVRQMNVVNTNNVRRIIPKSPILGRNIQFQERKSFNNSNTFVDNRFLQNSNIQNNIPFASSIVEFRPIQRQTNNVVHINVPRVHLQRQPILQSRINHSSNQNMHHFSLPHDSSNNTVKSQQAILKPVFTNPQKRQLSRIIERSEESVRNESFPDRSDYISSRKSEQNGSLLGNEGRRRLKKKGIEITNRVYFTNEDSKLV